MDDAARVNFAQIPEGTVVDMGTFDDPRMIGRVYDRIEDAPHDVTLIDATGDLWELHPISKGLHWFTSDNGGKTWSEYGQIDEHTSTNWGPFTVCASVPHAAQIETMNAAVGIITRYPGIGGSELVESLILFTATLKGMVR